MSDHRITRVISGVEHEITPLYKEGTSLKIEIWSNGTSPTVPQFHFSGAFLEPLIHCKDKACQKISIPRNARLFKMVIEFGLHPDNPDPLSQWVIARLFFWDSSPDPLLDLSIYLTKANARVIETSLSAPEEVTFN